MPVITIISAIIALSILIISHELGHFIAAKRSGIKVFEFSVGFGPRIVRWKRRETEYSIRSILFGGFIRMAGEDDKTTKGEDGEYLAKPPGIRAGVLVSGSIGNLILAVLFFISFNLFYGIGVVDTTVIRNAPEPSGLLRGDRILSLNERDVSDWRDLTKDREKESRVKIERGDDTLLISIPSHYIDSLVPLVPPILGNIESGSPACNAGLRRGDRVVEVNGDRIDSWENMVNIIQKSAKDTLNILVDREGIPSFTISLIPEERETMIDGEVKKVGMIGVAVYTRREGLGIRSFEQGIRDVGSIIYLTAEFIGQIITGRISARQHLGGPVSIVRFAGQSLAWGPWAFISFIAFLSCQLAILNLLPFPPLDGGHLFLIMIEKIRKRRLSEKVVSIIQGLGFALLIVFLLYITMADITRIFSP